MRDGRLLDVEPENWRTGFLKLKSVLYDRVTGLPSFPVHFDALRSALDRRRHLGVLHVEFTDLDLVEAVYGWQLFDQVVARAAEWLHQSLGRDLPSDTLLGQSGVAGGRFVAFVLQRPDGREVDAPYLAGLGGCVGAALGDALGADASTAACPRPEVRVGHSLLSFHPFYRFERRVYAAIDEARDWSGRRERRRERAWGDELHEIIRDARLRAFLQPVVALGNREVLGYEALMRGPSEGLFETPRAMFALSERLGSETELDRVCLAEALRVPAIEDFRGKLFVNLLPEGLAAGNGTLDRLEQLAAAARLSRADLVLELSERRADRGTDTLIAAMAGGRGAGFGVALDDVGTGPDSRALIERGRPHFVKLDVSLVRDVDTNLIKQEVLHSLVRLARDAGAEVIGEGVESEREARTLAGAGAAWAQGFLYGVPAPAAAALRRGGTRAG